MTLPIIEQLNNLQINTIIDTASARKELESVLACLSGQVFSAQNQAFHYLHQRSAPLGKIQATHFEQSQKLEQLGKEIHALWQKARQLCEVLPLADLEGVELFAAYLEQNNQQLVTELPRCTRNQALEDYKTLVRKCEDLASLATLDEKISGLRKIVADVKEKISKNNTPQALEVYDTLVLYVRYAALCCKRDAQEDQKRTVDQLLQENFSPSTVDLEGNLATDESVNKLLAETRAVELPNENKFRNGGWSAWLATIPLGRYVPIKNQIDTLEAVAKALYSMECKLHERMKKVSTEGLEEDAKKCQALQQLIARQFTQLAQVPLAREIHAGWHYVNALETQAKALQQSIRQFSGWASELALLNGLDEAVTGQSVIALVDLWNRAEVRRNMKLSKVVGDLFTRVGVRATKLTLDEQKVPQAVFSTSFTWGDPMSDHVQKYLLKGFLRFVHYQESAEKVIDPCFEAVFFTLKCTPAYKDGFALWLANSPAFKAMHDVYLASSEMNSSVLLINKMSKVASILSRRPSLAGKEAVEACLKEAGAVAPTVVGKGSSNDQVRNSWITKQMETFAQEFSL